jgi:chromosomal replication initiator protein
MILSAHQSAFSIPFRNCGSSIFSSDCEPRVPLGTQRSSPSNRANHLTRFVGDEANQCLRIFVRDPSESVDFRLLAPLWPLCLYGPNGTGKTSLALTLLADLSNEFSEPTIAGGSAKRSAGAMAMTATDFERRFRASLSTDLATDFRKKVTRSNALFIDGLEHLEKKTAAQQELVLVLDQMLSHQRPVIFTIQRPPQSYEGLMPQLVSRISGGLSIPVNEPGPVARSIIIRDFSQIHQLPLSDAAIEMLTARLTTSVPKINHFFGQLKTAIQLERKASRTYVFPDLIEPAFLARLFQHSPEDQARFIKAIIHLVADEFKVKTKEMASDSRKQTLVFARGVAIYLLRRQLALSFLKIGALFGGRDHSTIMHAYRKTESLIKKKDPAKPDHPNLISERNRILELEQLVSNKLASEIKFDL